MYIQNGMILRFVYIVNVLSLDRHKITKITPTLKRIKLSGKLAQCLHSHIIH